MRFFKNNISRYEKPSMIIIFCMACLIVTLLVSLIWKKEPEQKIEKVKVEKYDMTRDLTLEYLEKRVIYYEDLMEKNGIGYETDKGYKIYIDSVNNNN